MLRPALFLATLAFSLSAAAAVVGTNPPARALTSELIASLPAKDRGIWQEYLSRSEKQRAGDEAFLAAELKAASLSEPLVPSRGGSVSLKQPAAWYAGEEARHVADSVVSFQTPAGGWSKNTKMTEHARQPGERFGNEAGYVGTFDNDATITQLRFLARVAAAADPEHAAAWRAAFSRGVEYIFSAQYPNGGWPQVWPVEGGYHDAITFNDGAMIHVIEFLRDLAAGGEEFSIAPAALRTRAAKSMDRGLDCLLAAQIVVNGKRTVWCQQHDLLTLAPTSARNYEMPSQSSSESAEIMMFLMEIASPDSRTIAAVHGAAAWFQRTAIPDKVFKRTEQNDGRHLVAAPGQGPIWARYYEIGTDRPLFGDRDKTIHDNVEEISLERRNGYSWFSNNPRHVLDHYAKWSKLHPAEK